MHARRAEFETGTAIERTGHHVADDAVSKAGGLRLFNMSWRESGGPTVQKPQTTGFGHSIIRDMVARSLDGKASLEFSPPGVRWEIVAPEAALIEYSSDLSH